MGHYLGEVGPAVATRSEEVEVGVMAAHVLVVDDDKAIRESLGLLLQLEGYDVALAENGARALEIIRDEGMPRLMLLDLMMPVMSGWEYLVLAEEDQTLSRIPVVVISAMPAPLAPPEQKGGVKACLKKPVDIERLLALVQQLSGPPADAVERHH